jgi:arylsulfatase A-like enzyme
MSVSFALLAVLSQSRSPPEVVMLVVIDDLGFADIQPNGPWSPTPHIGALAKEGVLLANMHAYKYCSPSRRSLLRWVTL